MRLFSYNVHKGIGNDRRYNLDRIFQVIEAEKPDVICLQEVTRNFRRCRYHDQPQMLIDRLNAQGHLFQLNVHRHNGGYGNLLLSRWPLRVRHQVSLRMGERKPRGAQLAVIDTDEGPLHLVNWHLGLNEKERHWQVDHLLGHHAFREFGHLPTLIVGDFNDWRNTLATGPFANHEFRQVTGPPSRFRSFPSFLAVMSLDKAFCRGEMHIRHAHVVRNPLTRRASDHLPIVVDFHIGKKG